MPAEPLHPCGGRLRIHFQPPVCHNGLWLLDVFRFDQGRRRPHNPLVARRMDDLGQFEESISAALRGVGCDEYTAGDLRRDFRECRDEILADVRAHGGDPSEPFVNLVVISDVAVFTFFGSELSVYVVQCDEAKLISATNAFAMTDVDAHRELLANSYGKLSADAILSRSAGELWLG